MIFKKIMIGSLWTISGTRATVLLVLLYSPNWTAEHKQTIRVINYSYTN